MKKRNKDLSIMRTSAVCKKYDLQPWTIAEWRKAGKLSRRVPKGWLDENDVLMAMGKIHLANPTAQLSPIDVEKLSMSYIEAGEQWGVSATKVRNWKHNGLLSGPKNRVWRSEERPVVVKRGKTRGIRSVEATAVGRAAGVRLRYLGSPDYMGCDF